MTPRELQIVIKRAAKLGHRGLLGSCGSFAIAMNRVLLAGKGTYIACVCAQLHRHRLWNGHVVVRYGGALWDGGGRVRLRDFWGDTIHHDVVDVSRFEYLDPLALRPKLADLPRKNGVLFFEMSEAQVRRAFVTRHTQPVWSITKMLRTALAGEDAVEAFVEQRRELRRSRMHRKCRRPPDVDVTDFGRRGRESFVKRASSA